MQTALRPRYWPRALNRSTELLLEARQSCRLSGLIVWRDFIRVIHPQLRTLKWPNHRAPLFATALFLISLLAGCNKAGTTVLGQPPSGQPQTVSAARVSPDSSPIVLQGVLIEKCPVAGCWFRLRDQSGVIKVDTKVAGFVVTSVPLETKLTVAGKVAGQGDEPTLEATGLRY
jgi:uncharacterized protein YdeI (BOF family)